MLRIKRIRYYLGCVHHKRSKKSKRFCIPLFSFGGTRDCTYRDCPLRKKESFTGKTLSAVGVNGYIPGTGNELIIVDFSEIKSRQNISFKRKTIRAVGRLVVTREFPRGGDIASHDQRIKTHVVRSKIGTWMRQVRCTGRDQIPLNVSS